MSRPHDFHMLLRGAIQERGLTLEAIQRRLAARGITLARSTLSYWQNGHRRPVGAQSREAVQALEEILRLPRGRLLSAVEQADQALNGPTFGMVATGSLLDRLVAEIGCEGFLHNIEFTSYVDFTTIGPHGGLSLMRCMHTLRALADVDRYPAIHCGEIGGSAALIQIEAISGCRGGRVARDEENNVCVTELILDRPVRRGESHLVQYAVQDRNTMPANEGYMMLTTSPSLLAMEVTFHPDKLPVSVEEFERPADGEPDTFVRQRTLAMGWRVNVVRERARRGVVGLRWVYP